MVSFQETLALVRKNFTSDFPKSDVAYSIELETAVDVAASTYLMLDYNRQSYVILDDVLTAIKNTNKNIDYQLIASEYASKFDSDFYKTVINAVSKILSYENTISLMNIIYLASLKTSFQTKKQKLVSGLINLKDIIDDRTTDNIFVDNINETIKDDVDLNVAINTALKNHLELRNPSDLKLKQKQIIRTIRINEFELNIAKQNLVYIQEIIKSFSSSASKPDKTIEETQVENIVSLLLTYELLQKNLKYQVKLRKFDRCLQYNNEAFDGYFEYDTTLFDGILSAGGSATDSFF
jgi:hypothetical protein